MIIVNVVLCVAGEVGGATGSEAASEARLHGSVVQLVPAPQRPTLALHVVHGMYLVSSFIFISRSWAVQ